MQWEGNGPIAFLFFPRLWLSVFAVCLQRERYIWRSQENKTKLHHCTKAWSKQRHEILNCVWNLALFSIWSWTRSGQNDLKLSQSYQTLISSFFRFLLLSLSVCTIRKYFLYFKMVKLSSKIQKKIFILWRKKFVRIDSCLVMPLLTIISCWVNILKTFRYLMKIWRFFWTENKKFNRGRKSWIANVS